MDFVLFAYYFTPKNVICKEEKYVNFDKIIKLVEINKKK